MSDDPEEKSPCVRTVPEESQKQNVPPAGMVSAGGARATAVSGPAAASATAEGAVVATAVAEPTTAASDAKTEGEGGASKKSARTVEKKTNHRTGRMKGTNQQDHQSQKTKQAKPRAKVYHQHPTRAEPQEQMPTKVSRAQTRYVGAEGGQG